MSVATSLGISLVLQAGVRDTVVMIPASRGLIETVAMTGQFLVSILVLILLGGLLLQLVALRKAALEVTRILQTSSGDINAAAQSVRKVVDDVRGITQTVKTEVGAVSRAFEQALGTLATEVVGWTLVEGERHAGTAATPD